MVPKTPGEKPPGPILSQAQAEAGSGAEPWRSEASVAVTSRMCAPALSPERTVETGLPEVSWDTQGDPEANVQVVRSWFETHGVDPRTALLDLKAFLEEQVGRNRAIIVGSPVTFDFMWMYWYWWYLLEEMPTFGFSGLDIRSYFMGMHGVGFLGTGKERYLKHYPNEFSHTHDPLDDARQQGAIWRDMVAARSKRKAEEKKLRDS